MHSASRANPGFFPFAAASCPDAYDARVIVAVTGGAGFLGGHIVRLLLAEGNRVSVLLHPGGDRRSLEGLDVECVEGDLDDGGVPKSFLAGAEAVIHAAALYSERAEDRVHMERVNVGGTRAVLEAAIGSGVRRAVHVSTMGTCAPRPDGRPATEADRVEIGPATSGYVRTKRAAEDVALAVRGLEVIVVNPSAMAGAGDAKPGVTGRRILEILAGRHPRLVRGVVNHVPVSAAARGVLLALDRGRPGERYLLGGEDLPSREFLHRVAAAGGVPIPRRPWRDRLRSALPGPDFNLAIDDTKARRELGHAPGDLDAAFREAAAWFRAAGMVR